MTTVKHALSVSLYEGIIFLSYFKEKRIKKCQRKDVEESVDKIIANRMSKAYSEWKSNQDTQSFNENIEKEYQKLLETLSPEQEKVLTKYCDEIFEMCIRDRVWRIEKNGIYLLRHINS